MTNSMNVWYSEEKTLENNFLEHIEWSSYPGSPTTIATHDHIVKGISNEVFSALELVLANFTERPSDEQFQSFTQKKSTIQFKDLWIELNNEECEKVVLLDSKTPIKIISLDKEVKARFFQFCNPGLSDQYSVSFQEKFLDKTQWEMLERAIKRYREWALFYDGEKNYFHKDGSEKVLKVLALIKNERSRKAATSIVVETKTSGRINDFLKKFQNLPKNKGEWNNVTKMSIWQMNLSEREIQQLQIIMNWMYDRKENELNIIKSIPWIKSEWYKNNIKDYHPSGAPKEVADELAQKTKDSQNTVKSLIEMFSAWIVEQIIVAMNENTNIYSNIRMISTTPSDDVLSGNREKCAWIDYIILVDQIIPDPIKAQKFVEGSKCTLPFGIDIVNSSNPAYIEEKKNVKTVTPRNFFSSMKWEAFNPYAWLTKKNPNIPLSKDDYMHKMERHVFNIPLPKLVPVFKQFVHSELVQTLNDEYFDPELRSIRQSESIVKILSTSIISDILVAQGDASSSIVEKISSKTRSLVWPDAQKRDNFTENTFH